MRNLEIRGAGNLLGSEQSGHITAVGFELYCQLLKQSVSSLKGEKVAARVEVQVRLDFLALSPTDEGLKSKVSSLKSEDQPDLPDTEHRTRSTPQFSAFIPYKYISDSRQRIEIYRKLAQANEKAAVKTLERELQDR